VHKGAIAVVGVVRLDDLDVREMPATQLFESSRVRARILSMRGWPGSATTLKNPIVVNIHTPLESRGIRRF
jgi:hypothetical protein